MIDRGLWNYNVSSPWLVGCSYTPFNPSWYDGDRIYFFEVFVETTEPTSDQYIELVNTTTDSVISTITIPSCDGGESGTYPVRVLYQEFVPTSGENVYAIRVNPVLTAYKHTYVMTARICVLQYNATKCMISVPLSAGYGGSQKNTDALVYVGYTSSTSWNWGSVLNSAPKAYGLWKNFIKSNYLTRTELLSATWGNGLVGLWGVSDADRVEVLDHINSYSPITTSSFNTSSVAINRKTFSVSSLDYSYSFIAAMKSVSGTIYSAKIRLNLFYDNLDKDRFFCRAGTYPGRANEHAAHTPIDMSNVILQMSGALSSSGKQYNLGIMDHEETYDIAVNTVNACGKATCAAPNLALDNYRTTLVTESTGNVYRGSVFNINAGHIYPTAPPQCPLPTGLTYTSTDYCWCNLILLSLPD
jgi:hypothetical protein